MMRTSSLFIRSTESGGWCDAAVGEQNEVTAEFSQRKIVRYFVYFGNKGFVS